MHIFKLSARVGWGNEIHIKTPKGTYAGSGRCLTESNGIIYRKPSVEEVVKGAKASGHCSTPYVSNGDLLIYETDKGEEFRLVFKNVKYCNDPRDMFFADLVLFKEKISFVEKVKSLFNRKKLRVSNKPIIVKN